MRLNIVKNSTTELLKNKKKKCINSYVLTYLTCIIPK